KGCDLGRRCAFATADDRAGMTHSSARRGGRTGDKSSHGLFAIVLDPLSRFFFSRTADLADHDDTACFGIVVEQLDDIQMRGAVDRIAANADARRLADAAASQLPDRFVSQR